MKAQHIARVSKAGWKDWRVVRYAADDFVLVTNNASDFRRLYALQPLHAGLIVIIPSVNRLKQQRLFRAALDELVQMGELINRALESSHQRATAEGQRVTDGDYIRKRGKRGFWRPRHSRRLPPSASDWETLLHP